MKPPEQIDMEAKCEDRQDPLLLHIHGQVDWHGEAFILGNKDGLIALRNAINEAIKTTKPGKAEVCVSDGEGFHVYVIMDNSSWHDKSWMKAALPYTDEVAGEKNKDAVWPWQLVVKPDNQELGSGRKRELGSGKKKQELGSGRFCG